MKYGNAIKEVRSIGGYRLCAVFQDGYSGEVDLAPLFGHTGGPLLQAFQEQTFFAKVYVDLDAVAWPNGYDIDPDVLRFYCEMGRVCSREELAEAFEHPDLSSVLNDKRNP